MLSLLEVVVVAQSRRDSASPTPNVGDVVSALQKVIDTFDEARDVGLQVKMEPALIDICWQVVDRAGGRTIAVEPESSSSSERLEMGSYGPLRDVPLRRLVWQVIDPGQTFTVTDVADRLARLGVEVPTYKVSNALSYWASGDRLYRERKGIYHYPIRTDRDQGCDTSDGPPDSQSTSKEVSLTARRGQRLPTGSVDGSAAGHEPQSAVTAPRRKEDPREPVPEGTKTQKRHAM